MVANFYMPQSTLMMLTCAYGGYENVIKAYKEALKMEFPVLDREGNPMLDEETGEPLKERYRFGTYGDAMLILKD